MSYENDCDEAITAMVADQAPKLFAIVLEREDPAHTKIAAWGMAMDDSAYMITADGRNQYFLAEPENALMYVRANPTTTPHLVWATQD